jgi:hypothetical protein
MKSLVALLGLFLVVGCAEKPEPMAEPPAGEQTSAPGAGGGSDSIGIISPAAGTSAPVTNTDSVQGAGGGSVGAAAKGQAQKAAENLGGDKLSRTHDEGS